MNDIDVIDEIKRAVGPMPEPPAYRTEAIRHRARRVKQQRWSEAIGSAALVVAIVGGVVAVGGRAASGPARVADVLSTAETGAAEAGTARVAMKTELTQTPDRFPGGAGDTQVEGVVDFRNMATRIGSGTYEAISIGGVLYHRIPDPVRARAGRELDGKLWVAVADTSRGDGPFSNVQRPEDLLGALRDASGAPVRQGKETIRGVSTTVYRFDVTQALGGGTPTPSSNLTPVTTTAVATLAVDADGLPRRLTFEFVMTSPGLQAGFPSGPLPQGVDPTLLGPTRMEFDVSVEYYDYGVEIEPITAPPAAEVVDDETYEKAIEPEARRPRTVEECMQMGPNTSREKCEAMYGQESTGEGK